MFTIWDVTARPAILFGITGSQQTYLAGFPVKLTRKFSRFFPFFYIGLDFAVYKP